MTIIAWGNSLPDITADVAMTKRGFGEMAITGTIAGPIFNVMFGLGISMTITILSSDDPGSTKVNFSLFANGEYNLVSVLPLALIVAQIIVLTVLLISSFRNNFYIGFKQLWVLTIVYALVIIGLVVFSILKHIEPPSG